MTIPQNTGRLPKPRSTANLTARMGKGRPKGVPNKATTLAKNAIAEAADILGGTKRLAAWAAEAPENERVFWGTIYPKLLPLQVTGEGGGPLEMLHGPASAFDARIAGVVAAVASASNHGDPDDSGQGAA